MVTWDVESRLLTKDCSQFLEVEVLDLLNGFDSPLCDYRCYLIVYLLLHRLDEVDLEFHHLLAVIRGFESSGGCSLEMLYLFLRQAL